MVLGLMWLGRPSMLIGYIYIYSLKDLIDFLINCH